ncbi:MAG: acyl-CoA/acyl-ACP dehydrogenase, partial [Pseudomonadales bacterium]|nr:acyl-CoA/acyl-ACP dehydrogenase [Pseudomonadales bacterium]
AYAQLESAEMMIRKAAALYDSDQDCGEAANIAKYLASEAAWKAADETFQTYGGFAFAKEYQIERKWREVRLWRTAPISNNMVLNFICQNVLGLPKSY